jgi:salicylate hydroxylase
MVLCLATIRSDTVVRLNQQLEWRMERTLIVGAGIGGVALALALLRRGVDADVYEQAVELQEVGAGLSLSPNGTRVLYALGFAKELHEVAFGPENRELRLWNTGQSWRQDSYFAKVEAQYGRPQLFIHRGDLHTLLINAVRREKPNAIHVGKRFVGLEQLPGSVTIRFDDGSEASGGLLVGADGVKSDVRQALFGEDQPEFTPAAWRGAAQSQWTTCHETVSS